MAKPNTIQKVYEGKFSSLEPHNPVVTINGRPIVYYQRETDRRPAELTWGYGGSGPQALAHAIMLDLLEGEIDLDLATLILNEIVAKLPQDEPWMFLDQDVVMVIYLKGGHLKEKWKKLWSSD